MTGERITGERLTGEKQTGNLTPRETRGNGMNKECDADGDGMSDFLGQQEHFQNQFDNKNSKGPKNTKDGYFEWISKSRFLNN